MSVASTIPADFDPTLPAFPPLPDFAARSYLRDREWIARSQGLIAVLYLATAFAKRNDNLVRFLLSPLFFLLSSLFFL